MGGWVGELGGWGERGEGGERGGGGKREGGRERERGRGTEWCKPLGEGHGDKGVEQVCRRYTYSATQCATSNTPTHCLY